MNRNVLHNKIKNSFKDFPIYVNLIMKYFNSILGDEFLIKTKNKLNFKIEYSIKKDIIINELLPIKFSIDERNGILRIIDTTLINFNFIELFFNKIFVYRQSFLINNKNNKNILNLIKNNNLSDYFFYIEYNNDLIIISVDIEIDYLYYILSQYDIINLNELNSNILEKLSLTKNEFYNGYIKYLFSKVIDFKVIEYNNKFIVYFIKDRSQNYEIYLLDNNYNKIIFETKIDALYYAEDIINSNYDINNLNIIINPY